MGMGRIGGANSGATPDIDVAAAPRRPAQGGGRRQPDMAGAS